MQNLPPIKKKTSSYFKRGVCAEIKGKGAHRLEIIIGGGGWRNMKIGKGDLYTNRRIQGGKAWRSECSYWWDETSRRRKAVTNIQRFVNTQINKKGKVGKLQELSYNIPREEKKNRMQSGYRGVKETKSRKREEPGYSSPLPPLQRKKKITERGRRKNQNTLNTKGLSSP